MSKQSRSRRADTETTQTNWSLPSTAPLTPAPQPTVARAVQPSAAAHEQTASEPALEELSPAPLRHHLGGFSIFPESSAASAPPPSAPTAPPADGGLPMVQASLRVNTPGDVYEQEADRMADLVMRSPAGPDEAAEPSGSPDMPSYYVQRAPNGAGMPISPQVESSIGRMQGGGQPLPAGERSFFENRFGHDFSQIRIHADDHAAQTSRALNARAFTVGTDIAFDSGEYQPGTEGGRRLLAHELTHTIQQTGGVATKRVQRKAIDEEIEAPALDEAPSLEEAPAEQRSPVDLVAEAAQKLTDDEVTKTVVPPDESQPVNLPEPAPEDASGSTGGGGGAGGAEAAPAPAPAPQEQAGSAAAVAAQKAAEAHAKPATPASAKASAAGAPVGVAPTQAAPKPVPAEAAVTPAPTSAGAQASSAAPTAEAKASAPTGAEKAAPAPEVKAPEDGAASPAEQAAPAEERAQAEEQSEREADPKQARDASEAAADAPGAPRTGAREASGPDDQQKRVQRMPAGRMIQRAPRSPEEDPAFQAVTGSVKSTATEQKQHAPAEQKANEAAAAAKMPQEEKLGAAQNTQTVAIDAAAAAQEQAAQGGQAPGFDKEAFKASVKTRIDELTPKDPKQMEDIEGSGVFGDVKSAVDQKVDTGKDQAQGNVDDKVKEAPNPGAVPDKPTTPLQPNAPGQAPGQLDASGAAPKAKGVDEVETPLQQQSQQLDTEMAQAQVTPEQLQNSNEPTFQTALQAKTDAQAHVAQALPQYRAKEQGQIQGAQNEAGALAQTGLGAMFSERTGSFGQMDTLQNTAKGSDETKRAEIGRQIDGIFQRTKSDVEGILTALDTQVDQAFTSGADAAKQAAIDYIKRETSAYKAKRYGDDGNVLDKIGGFFNRARDFFVGMPDEYYVYYRQGRDLYIAEMDKVLDTVATIVGEHLARAHQRVQQGRDEIAKFVDSQPEELREVAQQAAQDAESKFADLEQTIDSKQNEIIDSLAQKYIEKLQALDSELEQMKEAEKGLLAKIGDLIKSVIKTILELKDLLLSILQRVASVILKILANPVAFFGNLISAVGQGLRQFVSNIGAHLQTGLIEWLTGALAAGGLQLPATWDLQGIFSLVMQILGLTYAQIRARIIKALGPIGEQVIGALEQAWDVFQIIQSEGIAGLWKFIQDQVGDLKAMVLDQIKEMVVGQVIKAGIEWLIGILGGPAGAFIKAVQAIVRVVSWFIENAARVASLVNSILDSVVAIADGDVGGAANQIEQSLAKAVPLVISFLASLLGLGGISHKVQEIIQKVRAPIQKAIDWLVQKAVALGKKLWGMLKGKDKKKDGPDERTRDDKERDLHEAIGQAERLMDASDATPESVRAGLPAIKAQYGLTSLTLVKTDADTYHVEGKVNPEERSKDKKFKMHNLELSGEEILKMIREIAVRIYNDEEVKKSEKAIRDASTVEEKKGKGKGKAKAKKRERDDDKEADKEEAPPVKKPKTSHRTTTIPAGSHPLGRARHLREDILRGDRNRLDTEKIHGAKDEKGNEIILSNAQLVAGSAPFLNAIGKYPDIAKSLQKTGKSPQAISQALQEYMRTGVVPKGFQDQGKLFARLKELMVGEEVARNPTSAVTIPMVFSLMDSPYDPKREDDKDLKFTEHFDRFSMTEVGAERIADSANKDLGYNSLMLKDRVDDDLADAVAIERHQRKDIDLAVDFVAATVKAKGTEDFKDVEALKAFIEQEVRAFYKGRTS